MYVVFIVLTIIVAVLLIGIVLIQKSKGGGLSSQFGGGNQVLGVRGTNSFLEKTTWTLAVLILILSVASAYTMPQDDAETVRTNATAANTQNQQQPGANAFDNQGSQNAGDNAQSAPAGQNNGAQ